MQTASNLGAPTLRGHNAGMAEKRRSRSDGTDVEPRFFTLEQTARYLNVSVPQVYALVRSGELPAIKIGGRGVWRVDRRQLDEYLERLMDQTKQWAHDHPLNPRDTSLPEKE
jgi:excisionase family DNA binding protein